jgi:hypothetical protein
MADPQIENPQTTYPLTPDPVLAGECWAVHPHFRHESCYVPMEGGAAWAETGQIAKFTVTTPLNGTPIGVTLGGATYIAANPSTDAELVAQLNAKLGSYATASSPGAGQLWVTISEPGDELVAAAYNPGTPQLTLGAGVAPAAIGATLPGRVVCWHPGEEYQDEKTAVRRYVAGGAVAGVALRQGLPAAEESRLRRAAVGGHPDGRSFLVAQVEYVSVEASGSVAAFGPVFVVHTPKALAGTIRGDDGGAPASIDVTVTPSNGGEDVGFKLGALAPILVASSNVLATDRTNLINAWNARPDYLAIGPAPTVVSGKLRVVKGSSGALPAFADASEAPAAAAAAAVAAGSAATADPLTGIRIIPRLPAAAGEACQAELAR